MSLYEKSSTPLRVYFPGVEVLAAQPGLSMQEFGEFVGTLVIPSHTSTQGALTKERPAQPLGDITEMNRSPDDPRDPWSPDHHWHTDRGYWGEQNQFATMLYAQRLSGSEIASTEIIDTTLLLDAAERDNPGITALLRPGTTVFSGGQYYTTTLRSKGSAEAIERTLVAKQCTTLEEVAAKEVLAHPPKRFPTITIHPFRGSDCIMIDEPRTAGIEDIGIEQKEVQHIIAQFICKYLALPAEELANRPYHAIHKWEPGDVLVWPQKGTLHRAQASPAGELRRNMLRLMVH
jgi:alpha-ketoglutarate-dependent taurine dioxygenase